MIFSKALLIFLLSISWELSFGNPEFQGEPPYNYENKEKFPNQKDHISVQSIKGIDKFISDRKKLILYMKHIPSESQFQENFLLFSENSTVCWLKSNKIWLIASTKNYEPEVEAISFIDFPAEILNCEFGTSQISSASLHLKVQTKDKPYLISLDDARGTSDWDFIGRNFIKENLRKERFLAKNDVKSVPKNEEKMSVTNKVLYSIAGTLTFFLVLILSIMFCNILGFIKKLLLSCKIVKIILCCGCNFFSK